MRLEKVTIVDALPLETARHACHSWLQSRRWYYTAKAARTTAIKLK